MLKLLFLQQQQLLSGGSVSSTSSGSAFKRTLHTQLSLPDIPSTANQQPTSILHSGKNQLTGSKISTSNLTSKTPFLTATTTTSLSTGSLPQAVHSEMNKQTRTVDSNKYKFSSKKDRSFSPVSSK